jgi:hypothetical protein
MCAHLYEWFVLCLHSVLSLRVEVVHGLTQQVGLVGVRQAGTRVLHLLRVVTVQLLEQDKSANQAC